MLNALCANTGSFNAADIAVLIILGIGLLFGIYKGFAKMLNGGMGTLIAIIAAIVLAVLFAEKFSGVSFLQDLNTTVETKIINTAEGFANNAKIENEQIFVFINSDWKPLTEIYSEGMNGKIVQLVQPILVKLCASSLDGTISVAAAIGGLVATVTGGAIIFVASIILIVILFNVLSSLLVKLLVKQKGLRVIDRLIGILFSTVISVAIIFFAFYLISKFGGNSTELMDTITGGAVSNWFYENNPFVILLG